MDRVIDNVFATLEIQGYHLSDSKYNELYSQLAFDLEALESDAFDFGYDEAYEHGYEEGYSDGQEDDCK
jgi:flagellar biosynthesis/type III secretory pathway protein FliH